MSHDVPRMSFYKPSQMVKKKITTERNLTDQHSSMGEMLSELHKGMVLSKKSKKQDLELKTVIDNISKHINHLHKEDDFYIETKTRIRHKDVMDYMVDLHRISDAFDHTYDDGFMSPDGGIVWLVRKNHYQDRFPLLISERKSQGTNDKIVANGGSEQAKGNAIERLSKNLKISNLLFMFEDIHPFVVFGSGCDFKEGSSILGRVSAMNNFLPLNDIDINKKYITSKKSGEKRVLDSSVMMFRNDEWKTDEIYQTISQVLEQSISYYRNKYDF